MTNTLLKLVVNFRCLKNAEEGQDVMEYALIAALISVGCIALSQSIAAELEVIYTYISNQLVSV